MAMPTIATKIPITRENLGPRSLSAKISPTLKIALRKEFKNSAISELKSLCLLHGNKKN